MLDVITIAGVNLDDLALCTFSSWQPKIGDPNLIGWLTVVFYLATFGLCVKVVLGVQSTTAAARLFWLSLCFLMLLLAVNKQLDLQSFATASARCVAKIQGWYRERAAFQFAVILSFATTAMIVGFFCLWVLRRDLKRNFLALLGLTIVLGFVMIRAVGFHYFDILIGIKVGPIRMNNILELSGLILISLNAVFLLKSEAMPPTRRRQSKQTKIYRREH
jgi:hypothetical protein